MNHYEYNRYRNGHSAGLGQGELALLSKTITDEIVKGLLPALKPIVAKAAEAAEPTISSVIKRDVVPWVVVGLIGVGAVAAAIGSWMATSSKRAPRRNPRRRRRSRR